MRKVLTVKFNQQGGWYQDTNQEWLSFAGFETILEAKEYPPFVEADEWSAGREFPQGVWKSLETSSQGIKLYKNINTGAYFFHSPYGVVIREI